MGTKTKRHNASGHLVDVKPPRVGDMLFRVAQVRPLSFSRYEVSRVHGDRVWVVILGHDGKRRPRGFGLNRSFEVDPDLYGRTELAALRGSLTRSFEHGFCLAGEIRHNRLRISLLRREIAKARTERWGKRRTKAGAK